MNRRLRNTAIGAAVLLGLVAYEAAAWGPEAKRAISITSIQVIRRDFPNAFRSKNNNYEEDVLRGAAMGVEVLAANVPLNSDVEAVVAVGSEVQLLREVAQYGMGSYFAYRMGVLAALVSDVMMPYSMTWNPAEMRVRATIDEDVDNALSSFRFEATQVSRQYVRDAQTYFESRRKFYLDDKKMITDDYARGRGYNGFLQAGAKAYFGRSIESIADAWYTVLRTEGDVSDTPPSPKVLTRYFLDEIAYLLNEKRNLHQADKTYENFVAVNPGLAEAYEQVGDLYYAYGTTEAKDRGVREWRIAFSMGGPQRRAVATKLSNHYLRVGETYLESGSRAGASERDLPNALDAFTQALEFDRGSDIAAKRLNETNVAIIQREQRRQLAIDIIASAEKVMKEAERLRLDKNYADAIATYRQAVNLFDAIDDEFTEQAGTATEEKKAINKNINDVIIEVLDTASEAIAQGERAVDEHRWDEALAAYESVPAIVSIIPSDSGTAHAQHKTQILEVAARKIDDAKAAKDRFEQAQKAREEAAKRVAPGAAPGTPGAPAPGTTPAPAPAPGAPAAPPPPPPPPQ